MSHAFPPHKLRPKKRSKKNGENCSRPPVDAGGRLTTIPAIRGRQETEDGVRPLSLDIRENQIPDVGAFPTTQDDAEDGITVALEMDNRKNDKLSTSLKKERRAGQASRIEVFDGRVGQLTKNHQHWMRSTGPRADG